MSKLPFRPESRSRRLLAGTAVIAALVISASFILTGSARAVDASPNSLTWTGGHKCVALDGNPNAGICVELGIYTSSNGQAHVTAQVEAICHIAGASAVCTTADIFASVESPSYNPTPGEGGCNPPNSTFSCQSPRTFLYPFGGIDITNGTCAYNVWAVVFAGPGHPSYVQAPSIPPIELPANLGTAHYDVCEGSGPSFTFTPIT